MKATLLLKKDHENIESRCNTLTNGASKDKDGQFAELCREIRMHLQLEQELFYPELQNSVVPSAIDAGNRAVLEHEEVDDLMRELAKLGGQNKLFSSRLAALVEKLRSHIEFEEDVVFEEARKVLTEYRLEELGLEMEDRRQILQITAA